VEAANADVHAHAPPSWLSQPTEGQITGATFVDDIMNQLERLSSGRCGIVCLTPITVAQALNIAGFLAGQVEAHPFIQECLANVAGDSVVLALATLEANAAGVMVNRPAPASLRAFYR
jgi:hypothetical protein